MMASVTETVIRDQFPYWEAALAMEVPRLRAGTVVVTGCGTSYYLAQTLACAYNAVGQRAIAVPGAEWARRPESYLADTRDILVIGLSRSGTTTETVQAIEASRKRGWPTFAVSCVPDVAILQAADRGLICADRCARGDRHERLGQSDVAGGAADDGDCLARGRGGGAGGAGSDRGGGGAC